MGVPPRRPRGAAGTGDGWEDWDGLDDEDAEDGDGLFGFADDPDTSVGRHASPGDRPGRLAGLLAAAGLPAVALGVALLASMVAVLSLMVGMLAVSRSGHRATVAAAGTPQAVVPLPPSPSLLPPPSLPVSLPPSPSPSPLYAPVYVNQLVRVQRSSCDGTVVDLDEPRVLPPIGGDLAYRTCDDGPHLDLDAAARFAVVDLPGATAQDCLDAIRLDPGLGWVAPDPNVTVCALTSPVMARTQGIDQKLVRVHVDSIDTAGTLLLSLTAWSMPAVP